MGIRGAEAPYKSSNWGKRKESAWMLQAQRESEVAGVATFALNELWFSVRPYIYDGWTQTCTYPQIVSREMWNDGLYPPQMTFLQTAAASICQDLYGTYFTRQGVYESTRAKKQSATPREMENNYERNYQAFQEAQAIARLRNTYVDKTRRHIQPTQIEKAAAVLYNNAVAVAGDILFLDANNKFYAAIAERAQRLTNSKHVLSDHVINLVKQGARYGVGHVGGELLKQLVGGPIGTVVT